jgi:hypothetical protein
MIYQQIITRLKELQQNGTDIGNAIRFCSDNIGTFDLTLPVSELVNICMENK